jgi:hypothetical protein
VTTKQTQAPEPAETEEQAEQDTFAKVVEAIDSLESEPSRHLSIQIDECVRDAVRAAQTSNQKASVTVVLKISPGPERRVSFAANVKAQIPRPPVSAATLYADAEGNVHASDPKQHHLEFYDATSQHPKKES